VPLPQPRISILVVLTAVLLAVTAGSARASAPTFALQPVDAGPYYIFDAQPGSLVEGRIRVANTGSRTGTARLYGVDAATGPTSGATYLTDPGHESSVGEWTHPAVGSVTLRPGETRVVPFQVLVPWGAAPGDHLGGITADAGVRRGRAVKRHASAFRIDVRTLTVIAVQVRVPGTRTPALAIDGIRAGGIPSYQQLFLRLRNPGNVLVKGRGSLVVRSRGGRVLKRAAFALDTFVPDTRIDYPVAVRGKALPKGSYRATITVRYAGRAIRRSFGFEVDDAALREVYGSRAPTSGNPGSGSPFLLIVGAVALLLLGFAGAWAWFRRRIRKLEARHREDDLRRLELWTLEAERASQCEGSRQR
jgi:hypothetical protein